MTCHFLAVLGASALALAPLTSKPALAHVVLERREATPHSSYRAVVQIGYGCQGSPTRLVRVTVPEGVIAAKPMPKPGWSVVTTKAAYARPYQMFGREVSEGVREITWSGGSLGDDEFDEFVFVARITDAFRPGESVHFPVVQDCASGSHRWVELPAAGRGYDMLKEPAPRLQIVSSGPTASPAAPPAPSQTTVRAGQLVIDTPWMRATPGGAKVAGGYVRIRNDGPAADRLVGASMPLSRRTEVHEMAVEGGVMTMRPVAGVEIRPGETVELKPGGLHLMFMDLTTGPKAGETLRGTLVFEKAGTVPVEFAVAPVGGSAAPAHHH